MQSASATESLTLEMLTKEAIGAEMNQSFGASHGPDFQSNRTSKLLVNHSNDLYPLDPYAPISEVFRQWILGILDSAARRYMDHFLLDVQLAIMRGGIMLDVYVKSCFDTPAWIRIRNEHLDPFLGGPPVETIVPTV
jgi:hypothetical protein